MDYGYDSNGYDYDPFEHMTNDPVDFQTHGYGGFGYDTSHVKADGEHCALYQASEAGNMTEVQAIISKETSTEKKLEVVNNSRR